MSAVQPRCWALLLALLSGCAHCPGGQGAGPDPVLGTYLGPALPMTELGLLEEADRAAEKGPAGPDLVRSYRAAYELLRRSPQNSEAAWRAARALYFLTLKDPQRAAKIAKRCVQLVEPERFLPPNAKIFHYGSLCLGARARAKKTEALKLLPKMLKQAKKATELGAGFDRGGPHRVLGGIYLKAPAWPLSIGDLDEALVHLEKAIALAPGWAENHLMMAEALIEDERIEEAVKATERAKQLMQQEDHAGWLSVFMADLARIEERLREEG